MLHRLALLVVLLTVGAACADEVILVNGDRITGTVVRKEGDASNAGYWYARARRNYEDFTQPTDELQAIAELLESE